MPVKNGIGFSEYTEMKQEIVSSLFRMHLQISKGILSRWSGHYGYFDLTAGNGFANGESGLEGSPLIFARQAKALGVSCKMFCFERTKESATRLADRLRGLDFPTKSIGFVVIPQSYQDFLEQIIKASRASLGLIYLDPTGNIPDLNTIAEVSRMKEAQRIDILINLRATTIKRADACKTTHFSGRLKEMLSGVDKKAWIVRKPYSRQQWTFLLGSNWVKFPTWEKQGFYNIESKTGAEILDKLSMTRPEIEKAYGDDAEKVINHRLTDEQLRLF